MKQLLSSLTRWLMAGVLAGLATVAAPAPFSFSTIDVPGASATWATGINDSGEIVGYFDDSKGTHGFVYVEGQFNKIDVPGVSGNTLAMRINNSGHIVGTVGGTHGFLDVSGNFSTFDFPSATGTFANGINDGGQIVGTYNLSERPVGPVHGFLYVGSTFTTIDDPHSDSTSLWDINNTGLIVGSTGSQGFLKSGESFSPIDAPGAIFPEPLGIDNDGRIVGRFLDSGSHTHGFLDVNGKFSTIDLSGAVLSEAWDINRAGQIVGVYFGPSFDPHGFLLTIPEPGSLVLFGAGLWGIGFAWWRKCTWMGKPTAQRSREER
jgi:probable HAF family extracellular repeat protein